MAEPANLMDRMTNAETALRRIRDRNGGGGHNGGNDGGGPPMAELEHRVERIEDEMRGLRDDVTAIKSNYAKDSDLHRAIGAQTWKMITAIGLMTAVFAAIVKWPL